MKQIKLCTIGAGGIAESQHGPALRQLLKEDSALELAAVCDLVEAKAKAFSENFGYQRCYTDFKKMLETEKPDGVTIYTPANLNAQIGGAVSAMGFPVLLEKPPGRNRAQIEKLMEISANSGKAVMVAFNRRYSPALKAATEVLNNDFPEEEIEFIRAEQYRHERNDADFATTSIHVIDAVRHLAGAKYQRVDLFYQELKRKDIEHVIYNTLMAAEFCNGLKAQISIAPMAGANVERYTILTRNVMIEIKLAMGSDRDSITLYHHGRVPREIELPSHPGGHELFLVNGIYSENRAFVDALRNGFNIKNDLELSLDAVEIADAQRHRKASWGNHRDS